MKKKKKERKNIEKAFARSKKERKFRRKKERKEIQKKERKRKKERKKEYKLKAERIVGKKCYLGTYYITSCDLSIYDALLNLTWGYRNGALK